MEQTASLHYKALDTTSYNSLAAYVVTLGVTVTLFPDYSTIVMDKADAETVEQFINAKGLKFDIKPFAIHDENLGEVIDNPTTDAETMRLIAYRLLGRTKAMTDKLKDAESGKEQYCRFWDSARKENNRIKAQVENIAQLMLSIFPKD